MLTLTSFTWTHGLRIGFSPPAIASGGVGRGTIPTCMYLGHMYLVHFNFIRKAYSNDLTCWDVSSTYCMIFVCIENYILFM
jgi:hypothetical protein